MFHLCAPVCQTPGYEARSRVDDPASPASRPCRRQCRRVSRCVAPSYGFGRQGHAETTCLTSLAPRPSGGCPPNGGTGRRRAWTHCPRHPAAVIDRPPDPSRKARLARPCRQRLRPPFHVLNSAAALRPRAAASHSSHRCDAAAARLSPVPEALDRRSHLPPSPPSYARRAP